MNQLDCLNAAQRTAESEKVKIAVVDDPIANAEEEDGPFGYCPVEAVGLLFPHGRLVCVINPDGSALYSTPLIVK